MMRKTILVLLVLSLTVFASKPCHVNRVVALYDAVLTFPAPSWVHTKSSCSNFLKEQAASKFDIQQTARTYHLSIIPPGENFKDWRRIYGVTAYYDSNRQSDWQSALYDLSSLIAPYCIKSEYHFAVLEQNHNSKIIYQVCGKFKAFNNDFGYTNQMGEVAIFRLFKFKDTWVRIFHEWRGPYFNLSQKSTWPVNQKNLSLMLKRLRSAKINGVNEMHDKTLQQMKIQ